MKHIARKLAAILALGLSANAAQAGLVQTTGSGSAVTTVAATANFESNASLGMSYTEGGLTFTRVGISNDNNGCGYAGCAGAFPGFSGNYFYGYATSGSGDHYVRIDSTAGDISAIEFAFGWNTTHNFFWQAMNDNVVVGSGSGSGVGGTVFGLSGAAFDRLNFSMSQGGGTLTSLQGTSAAVDNVRVGGAAAANVPEPGSVALVGLGLLAAAGVRRRRAAR